MSGEATVAEILGALNPLLREHGAEPLVAIATDGDSLILTSYYSVNSHESIHRAHPRKAGA